MSGTTETITQVEDVKRESYGIELGMIQDMYEAGDINRAQARSLRRNIYVMQVDADSGIYFPWLPSLRGAKLGFAIPV